MRSNERKYQIQMNKWKPRERERARATIDAKKSIVKYSSGDGDIFFTNSRPVKCV